MNTPPSTYRILVIDDTPSIHDDFGKILTPDQRRNRLHDVDKKLFAASRGYRLTVIWEADITRRGVELPDLLDIGQVSA